MNGWWAEEQNDADPFNDEAEGGLQPGEREEQDGVLELLEMTRDVFHGFNIVLEKAVQIKVHKGGPHELCKEEAEIEAPTFMWSEGI